MGELRQPTQLESVQSVARRLGISRSRIYAWVSQGRFPPPTKLGRSSRWMVDEVDAWIRRQITDGQD
ncbi:helix-turn-helix domain-containing protein [Pseudoxanthomonas sp. KAs_5_3]|nr:helix-turn-helix domain-containing protein [Pseudoxanthomonas sp. KAs_5_3]SFV25915.1 transcriptional regulator, AlpA family [Pseudoxanthomonas sp. YR558]